MPVFELIAEVAFAVIVLYALSRAPAAMRDVLQLTPAHAPALAASCRSTDCLIQLGFTPRRVLIDLAAVAQVDDSVLAALTFACRRWQDVGATVAICGCSDSVERALASTRLSTLVIVKERRASSTLTLH